MQLSSEEAEEAKHSRRQLFLGLLYIYDWACAGLILTNNKNSVEHNQFILNNFWKRCQFVLLQQSDVCSINFIVDLYITIVIFLLTNRVAGKQLLMLCYVALYVCVWSGQSVRMRLLWRVWPHLDNFQWVYLQKARKESALVRNMELDVTNKGLD